MEQIRLDVDRLGRVVWESIHFTTANPSEVVQEINAWPNAYAVKDWPSFTIRTINANSSASLTDNVAKALGFPAYYGHNLDALYDCLGDLSWLDFQALVLVVDNASHLWTTAPKDAGVFVGVWLSVAEEWGREGKPFHLVFCL